MTALKFVPDDRYATAPPLPLDRPPTRAECWEHYNHYFEGVKEHHEIVAFARDQWAWIYVRWVNTQQWRRPPDWTPDHGDIQINISLFPSGRGRSYYNDVRALMEQVRERKAA